VDWRSAHQVVGLFVRLCVERGLSPESAGVEVLDEAAQAILTRQSGLGALEFEEAMDPVLFVSRRTLLGGPSPQALRRETARFHQDLTHDMDRIAQLVNQSIASEARLEESIDLILAGSDAP